MINSIWSSTTLCGGCRRVRYSINTGTSKPIDVLYKTTKPVACHDEKRRRITRKKKLLRMFAESAIRTRYATSPRNKGMDHGDHLFDIDHKKKGMTAPRTQIIHKSNNKHVLVVVWDIPACRHLLPCVCVCVCNADMNPFTHVRVRWTRAVRLCTPSSVFGSLFARHAIHSLDTSSTLKRAQIRDHRQLLGIVELLHHLLLQFLFLVRYTPKIFIARWVGPQFPSLVGLHRIFLTRLTLCRFPH